MRKFLLLMTILGLCLPNSLWAQERTVSGKVTSEVDGSSLPGVSVLLKGTSTGTVTDVEGNYRLSVPTTGGTLTFSFIGFTTTDVAIGANSVIDVTLSEDVKQLSEVVVVGYGTQLKQDLTGNIAKVSGSQVENIPVPSFEQAIQGRAAGVFVEASNGKLGQGIKVRVRGTSSLSAGSQPLYVVDGVPITSQSQTALSGDTNPLADLNSFDIESIEILKDASAAAIYGSRGANGVVIITTKRGKSEKTNFNVNFMTGFSEPTNHVEWLNTAEYVELFQEARANTGYISVASLEARLDRYAGGVRAAWQDPSSPSYVDTDWDRQALVRGSINQIDFSASGGTEKTRFYTSLSSSNQDGILLGTAFDKVNGRINLDHEANDKLSLGMSFSLGRTINSRVPDDNAFSTPLQMIALPPLTPIIDTRTNLLSGVLDLTTGLPNSNFPLYYNPLIDINYNDNTNTVFRNLGTFYGSYNILDNLRFRSEFGYDLLSQHEERYLASVASRNTGAPNGQGDDIRTQVFNYTTNNFLSYNVSFGQHELEAVGGMSFQNSNANFARVQGQQFPSDSYRKITSAASITLGNATETEYSFLSYFARANYKFANKYLLSLSGRVDGSSRFGPDNRYGFFPAASAGWILSEEQFLSENNTIEFLKLRVSYGLTGNAEIGNFPWQGLSSGDGGYAGVPGQRPSQLANPDLRWEQTSQLDFGIDFGFLNNRITGEVDYYVKNTSDLLLNVNLPGTAGAARTQVKNLGNLENKGFELVINSVNLTGELKWNTSFNFARNRNLITDIQDQVVDGNFLSRAVEGEPIGIFYGPKYAGVDPANGDALYFMKDANGELTATTNDYNAAEFTKIGDPNPDFIWGITNNFSYKGIELSVLFQGVQGNDIYLGGGKFFAANGDFFDNQRKDQLNRWRNPGDITNIPQARLFDGNGTGESSRYVEDGSYVRLKTLTLGYNLPRTLLSKTSFTKVRIYASAQNLLTFTDYKMWDPEVNTDLSNAGPNAGGNVTTANVSQGIDFYSAPQAKMITFGLNIGF
ncbi:MAG TPA: SusC/RagA family TonB-linked outer membrane protein [Cytophagales bacterium]|nr:SusC/RagA family TonB-linked outer membrane protein [Cytophagales bacterium]